MSLKGRGLPAAVLAAGLGLLQPGRGEARPVSAVGTNQPVLVVCVRYSDVATTRLAACTDWVDLLGREANRYFNQATYGQTNFRFETPSGPGLPAGGWFSLGYAAGANNYWRIGQDAVNLADPFVDFNRFDRVVVISNSPAFGGTGGGPYWWRVAEGVEMTVAGEGKRAMTLSVANEWQATGSGYGGPGFDEGASVVAHEIGHQLGVPVHYDDVRWFPGSRDAASPWDLMGYSPTLFHFIGWAKSAMGWLPEARVSTLGPPEGSDIDVTQRIRPQAVAMGSGTQLIRVPFTRGEPYRGYVVENRRRLNGDENLRQPGVLVTLVDAHPETVRKAILMDDPDAPGDVNEIALEVGDSFTDAARRLTISVVAQVGEDYDVRVQYLLPPSARPDAAIQPWAAPPWETPDIWVDSERNGWGTYRYVDSTGQPTGSGDDAWVNRANRVYVRVRNLGAGLATNVRVQVFANQPPGMGDAGPTWAYLGTILFPSIAPGTTVQDYVPWRPELGAHTCLRAVILDTPGELSTSNNRAQENISNFDSFRGSPFKPFELKMRVFNPFKDQDTPVRFNLRDVPGGWDLVVDPPELTLAAGEHAYVSLSVFPSGAPGGPINEQYTEGFLGMPKIEALVPYADTFIAIGGVEARTRLTFQTALDAYVYPTPQGTYVCGQVYGTRPEAPPLSSGTVVAVEFTGEGTREVFHTETASDGYFCGFFNPKAGLPWTVQASFAGDTLFAASESVPVQVP